MGSEMKHANLRWNPGTGDWVCTKCRRTSGHVSVHDAQQEWDQYDCGVQLVGGARPVPGTETKRLRKAYKIALKTERNGCRFVAQTEEEKPIIRLDLFHDTVSGLRSLSDSNCLAY